MAGGKIWGGKKSAIIWRCWFSCPLTKLLFGRVYISSVHFPPIILKTRCFKPYATFEWLKLKARDFCFICLILCPEFLDFQLSWLGKGFAILHLIKYFSTTWFCSVYVFSFCFVKPVRSSTRIIKLELSGGCALKFRDWKYSSFGHG